VSTSWWAPEIVAVAQEHAPAELADVAERLLAAPGSARAAPQRVTLVSRDGAVTVDGRPLEDAAWRQGRSGSGVLRRYFRALVSAYPASLARDELADLLWPESEGDKAVRNLYDATKDLRRVLGALPGVRLEVAEGAYRLVLGAGSRVG
jgi:two-component SAPR family response regulator